jgi:membrane-associated protein
VLFVWCPLRGLGRAFSRTSPAVVALATWSGLCAAHDVPGLQAPNLVERYVASVTSALGLTPAALVISAVAKAHSAGGIQGWLLGLHGPVVYAAVGALLFLEVGIIVGQHHANLVVMIAVVAVCASLGNVSGYFIGKTIGPWILELRFLKGNAGIIRTRALIAHHGGPAVFIGRWVVFVRAVLPGVAGMSHMRLTKFILFSVAGGIVWGTMWVLIGFAAGDSYTSIEKAVGNWSLVILGVVVVALVVFIFFRKRKEKRENRELLERTRDSDPPGARSNP